MRGRAASTPKELGGKGWWDVLVRIRQQVKEDDVGLLAAGVAFYVLLSIIPALAAVVSLYGLVADPADVARQLQALAGTLPGDSAALVEDQLSAVTSSSSAGLGLGLAVSLAAALWGASKGMRAMVTAINAAYDEDDDRGLVRTTLLSLGLTLGLVLLVGLTVGILAVLPFLVQPLGDLGAGLVTVLRWPLLALVVLTSLSVLYRLAPARSDARWAWITPGALFATLGWIVASALFTVYVNSFGSFNETYGTLGAVVVLLLWLQISFFVVLVGAELNAEAERQTKKDTTTGNPQPLGDRDAYAADTVGRTAAEVKAER